MEKISLFTNTGYLLKTIKENKQIKKLMRIHGHKSNIQNINFCIPGRNEKIFTCLGPY